MTSSANAVPAQEVQGTETQAPGIRTQQMNVTQTQVPLAPVAAEEEKKTYKPFLDFRKKE